MTSLRVSASPLSILVVLLAGAGSTVPAAGCRSPSTVPCPGGDCGEDEPGAGDTDPGDTDPGDTDPGDTDPEDSGAAPVDRSPFTVVVLPDTQEYADRYPAYFERQAEWIVEEREARDIRFVLHEGDVTDDNSDEQWAVADGALGQLDGEVPYAFSLGNHDLGEGGSAADRSSLVDDWFPPERFEDMEGYGGNQSGSSDNSWATFDAAGMSFLVLALEFGPSDETLAWAASVVEEHPDHRVILVTHCYMYHDDTRVGAGNPYSPHSYGIDALGVNDGDEIWEELVSLHGGFFLVVSGHVTGDGTGYLVSDGVEGNPVHQMLANYQQEEQGGRGWLRILEFVPEEDRVEVSTYSPVVADQEGEAAAWRTEPDNAFSFALEMALE